MGCAERPRRVFARRAALAGTAAALLGGIGAGAQTPPCDAYRAGAEAVVLRAGYYPSLRKLRVHVDVSAAPFAATVRGAVVEVRPAGGSPVATTTLPLSAAAPLAERVVDLPPLAEGAYEVEARLDVGACRALPVAQAAFEHRVFGWEGNRIGDADVVVPPFTPVAVSGSRVGVVLRSLDIDALGLWREIESVGAPLLRAPAYWRVAVDGVEAVPRPTAAATIETAGPTRARVRAAWEVRGLRAAVDARIEQDGLVWVDVRLAGSPALRVDRLDLVIPLRAEHATLLNAITDGAHHHTIGALPEGNGVVWNSLRTRREEIPPELVPYVWIGDEERGLAWMAESTRDWLVADGVPTQEIVRRADGVDLVIHFATRPGALQRDRTLSFGIQPTPVKPRPDAPAPWRAWQLVCGADRSHYWLCPLPASAQWGARALYAGVAPQDGAPLRWIAAARRSGIANVAAVAPWLSEKGVPDGDRERAKTELEYGLRMAATRSDALIFYVTAHYAAASPDFAVYADEWRPAPFGDRAGADANETGEVPIRPVRSWQDFALWNFARLLASGAADGFFIDNTYLRASFDDVAGPAYRDDAGRLRPGVDLLGSREFLKRLQTLVYDRRGAWLNVAHMTTTPIAPVQGWAGVSLDGEWRYGTADYQARFPRAFLRSGSLGAQTGTVPVYLPGLTEPDPGKRARLERSLAGVTAVHEIRVMARFEGPLASIWDNLAAFGYAERDALVRRYWDADPGFALRGGDAEALVVARGGDALALVVSFGADAAIELDLDAAALGLGAGGRCADLEREGPVETSGTGCRFALPRHDYRLIRYRAPK